MNIILQALAISWGPLFTRKAEFDPNSMEGKRRFKEARAYAERFSKDFLLDAIGPPDMLDFYNIFSCNPLLTLHLGKTAFPLKHGNNADGMQ